MPTARLFIKKFGLLLFLSYPRLVPCNAVRYLFVFSVRFAHIDSAAPLVSLMSGSYGLMSGVYGLMSQGNHST